MQCVSRFAYVLRWTSLFVCLTFVISSVPGLSMPSVSATKPLGTGQRPQSKGKARKVKPAAPEKGRPAMNLPNLDETRQQTPVRSEAPLPIPSTVRSKRKPLEPLNNKRVSVNKSKPGALGNVRAHHAPMAASAVAPPSGATDSQRALARLDPFNQTGDQIAARDCEWSLPLLNLPGRGGLDLGLTLSYSSLVWSRAGDSIYFDEDNGNPSPGFRLGFPTIGDSFFDTQANVSARLLTTSAGRRVELRQVGSTNVYEAGDSSYLQMTDNGNSLLLRTTEGTQITYASYPNGWQATQVKDRNGNYISISNNALGDLETITDTLGRVINFHYDNNANLDYIWQSWNGTEHRWATFDWGGALQMDVSSLNGAAVVGTYTGDQIPVLRQVHLPDHSYYSFEYNALGQVKTIRRFTEDTVERAHMAYDYDNPNSDCPRITQTRVAADNWTGIGGVPSEVTTQFSVNSDGSHQMTTVGDPNITAYKEIYGTGWKNGLVTQSEVWSAGVRQKWTVTEWHQENESVGYQTNPRVTETNIYDADNNRRRTTIDYGPYVQYGLPYVVVEYAAGGSPEIRRTYTEYNLTQSYLQARIIGLRSNVRVYDSTLHEWQSKTSFEYDATDLSAQAITASHHDQTYDNSPESRSKRGNLTGVSRWDYTDIDNPSKALTTYISYDAAGSPVSTTEPATHTITAQYSDSFADGANHNTYAYPTTLIDGDGNSSYVQYNFDFGVKTRTEGPPLNQSAGAVQNFGYDDAGRLAEVYTPYSGAATIYTYGPYYAQSWSSVNSLLDNYSFQMFDGLGRVVGTANSHPGSAGGYRAQITRYDLMGRALKQSNPTEINGSWVPSGDDAGESSAQPVSWTNLVGVTATGNYLTKTAADGWTSGAVSTQAIAGGDGYVEFTASETNSFRMLGLSNGDTNQTYGDIDYAMYLAGNGHLYIYEGGTYLGDFGVYATGDVLRVGVESGAVKYRKNGQLLYTSSTAPAYPLLVDTSLHSQGATLTNVYLSSGGSGGWVYSQQTYDWKGRPLVTENTDGTIKYASYGGCGCAGGETVTLTDEMGRQQKVYSDVLGRQVKTEVLNWNGSVYSTRVLDYNTRDQITSARQYEGTEASGVYQQETETYDGYGRLATRRAPIQTAETTYNYYPDDKPQTVTDARGVTTTYSYNGRGLVTGVSSSGGGYPAVAISYGYDAAANRTSMTDDSGHVSYQYDSLSRLVSETKQFAGSGAPSGNYSLSYEYNLAGQLKAITDPTGSRVDYGFDSTGRLTSVTGSGANSAPTYASNFAYRSWGAIRDFDFGNGVHQHLNFDSRLQNTSLGLSNLYAGGAMNWSYDYYADGKLQSVADSAAPNFDRFFDYDHEGRISNALTGSEARGGTTADGPFKQTYSYDVWENTTSRTGRSWTQPITNGNANYPNNRNQNWQYDSQGNVTGTYDANFSYDAAGRNNHYSANVYLPNGQSILEISQTFDGNSTPASKTVTRIEDPNAPASITRTYYLRSSALGGKVVAELDSTGYKRVGHVYAGGMEIAKQTIGSPGYASQVSWASTNPATGSEYALYGDGSVVRQELDPLGADVTAAPSNPLAVNEPAFYNPKFDRMPLEYEGGQTADAGVASWYVSNVNAEFDRHMADLYWQHGFRDEAQQIVANNPNVRVQSGEVTRFGQDAVDFLKSVPRERATFAGGMLAHELGHSPAAGEEDTAQDKNEGTIEVNAITYQAIDNGVHIRLLAGIKDSPYEHFNWIQLVTTNSPRRGNPPNKPVTDRDPGQLTPFYWNSTQQTKYESMAQAEGGSTIFTDYPSRAYSGTPVYWHAKLYLVGIRSNGSWDALRSYSYGFTLDANGVHLERLRRIQ